MYTFTECTTGRWLRFRQADALDGLVVLDGDGEHIATIFDTQEET